MRNNNEMWYSFIVLVFVICWYWISVDVYLWVHHCWRPIINIRANVSLSPWNYCSTAYQYEFFNSKMTLFVNESTNESVYVSIPSVRSLLQDNHIFALVVLPLAGSIFRLFPFIHIICIISSSHEMMKTWKALLVLHCPFTRFRGGTNICLLTITCWHDKAAVVAKTLVNLFV